jgi:hypothetical protein
MNRIIMRSNKVAGFFNTPAPSPLGVEYEQLKKKLNEHTIDKYRNRTDLRRYMPQENVSLNEGNKDNKTFILSPPPRINFLNDQHDTSPYPQSDVPYSNGSVRWE